MTFIRLSLFHPQQKTETSVVDVQDIRQRLSVILASKYRILDQLGGGGMATVWMARHREHGALFAVKVLNPAIADIPELREAFHHEAIYTAALAGHPNIIPIFDIDQADGLHYLVMPYIRGYDLDEALNLCNRFEVTDAITISLEIAKALAYAEERGIFHGDLTPGNIRIDDFGRIFLLDFGLSWYLRTSGSAGKFKLGTPYVMSPEQIRGGALDIRSDLYALGILLYQMVTGSPPFHEGTIEEIEKQHLTATPQIPAELNQAYRPLCGLLEQLLAKDPNSRPLNAKELEQRLIQIGGFSRPLDIPSLFPASKDRNALRRRLSGIDS